jgi:hypothetical protein
MAVVPATASDPASTRKGPRAIATDAACGFARSATSRVDGALHAHHPEHAIPDRASTPSPTRSTFR